MLTLVLLWTSAAAAAPPPGWTYVGAFRLPMINADADVKSFRYAPSSLAFNPANKTLFASAGAQLDQIGEISIPEPSLNADLDHLPRAELVQPLHDILSRVPTHPIVDRRLGGLLVHDGSVIGTEYSYYEQRAKVSQSHFRVATTSLDSEVTGLFSVGPLSQPPRLDIVGGYMGHVPESQQKDYGGPCLTGTAGLAIVSGASSGPAVSVFDPAQLGPSTEPTSEAPATPLVYYPESNPLTKWSASDTPYFNGTSEIRGVMMEEDGDIVFWGSHGIGAWFYGALNDARGENSTCHAAPYRYQFWHYAKADLMAVKRGAKRPWQITPTVHDVTLPFSTPAAWAGGMAYDAATGRAFVTAAYCDETMPIIHVYQVEADATPDASGADSR